MLLRFCANRQHLDSEDRFYITRIFSAYPPEAPVMRAKRPLMSFSSDIVLTMYVVDVCTTQQAREMG